MNANEHDPSSAPQPIRLTEEELARHRAEINEDELAEELREFRERRGRKLDDFIGELEKIGNQTSEPTSGEG